MLMKLFKNGCGGSKNSIFVPTCLPAKAGRLRLFLSCIAALWSDKKKQPVPNLIREKVGRKDVFRNQ